jgi:hypothetical protein
MQNETLTACRAHHEAAAAEVARTGALLEAAPEADGVLAAYLTAVRALLDATHGLALALEAHTRIAVKGTNDENL